MSWALGVPPSRLREAYWSLTLGDIRSAMRLRFGFEHAKAVQHLDDLVVVVSRALGSGKSGGVPAPPPEPPKNAFPTTVEELRARMLGHG